MPGLICTIMGHQVDRRKVWFDDCDFRTNCGRCGLPLLRDDRGWREFDSERDIRAEGPHRKPHPRHRE